MYCYFINYFIRLFHSYSFLNLFTIVVLAIVVMFCHPLTLKAAGIVANSERKVSLVRGTAIIT